MKKFKKQTEKEKQAEQELDLLQLLDKLHVLMLERWEYYKDRMDFNATKAPSPTEMQVLKEKTQAVNRIHNLVNKKRLEAGHDPEQVKMEDVRRIMNVDGNACCAVLFKA